MAGPHLSFCTLHYLYLQECNEPALATRIWGAHSPACMFLQQGGRAGVAGIDRAGSLGWGPVGPSGQALDLGVVWGGGPVLQNVKPLFIPNLSSWPHCSWWWRAGALPAPALGSQGGGPQTRSQVCPSHPACNLLGLVLLGACGSMFPPILSLPFSFLLGTVLQK